MHTVAFDSRKCVCDSRPGYISTLHIQRQCCLSVDSLSPVCPNALPKHPKHQMLLTAALTIMAAVSSYCAAVALLALQASIRAGVTVLMCEVSLHVIMVGGMESTL